MLSTSQWSQSLHSTSYASGSTKIEIASRRLRTALVLYDPAAIRGTRGRWWKVFLDRDMMKIAFVWVSYDSLGGNYEQMPKELTTARLAYSSQSQGTWELAYY